MKNTSVLYFLAGMLSVAIVNAPIKDTGPAVGFCLLAILVTLITAIVIDHN